MSIFVLFVTNTQLFLNHQPFPTIKNDSCILYPSTASSAWPRGRPTGGQKGSGCCPFSAPCPHHEPAPTQFSATKQTASWNLFRGLCLWWFLLSIISLYISGQLAGSHLILTGQENLISCTRKTLEKLGDELSGSLD